MRVHFEILRDCEQLPSLLTRDHWTIEQEPDDSLLAWHPDATDMVSVRSRLHRLGLLTSGSLRIELDQGA